MCKKISTNHMRVANNSQEKFTILHVSHIGFLCYLVVIRKLFRKQGININAALRGVRKI